MRVLTREAQDSLCVVELNPNAICQCRWWRGILEPHRRQSENPGTVSTSIGFIQLSHRRIGDAPVDLIVASLAIGLSALEGEKQRAITSVVT